MSGGRKGLDPSSRLGRAVFALVDATMKMPVEVRARVVRVRNMIEADPDDPIVASRVEPDLTVLMRDSKLNGQVRMLRRMLRQTN